MKKLISSLTLLIIMLAPLQVLAIPYYNWDFNLEGYDQHTYDYADVVDLQGTRLGFLDTYSWAHYLPEGFNNSTNSVTDAKLWVTASGVLSDYLTVAHIQGIGEWVFLEGQDWHWSWRWGIVLDDQTSETVINLPTNMENFSFWQYNPINVTVGTGQFFTDVTLEQSVLMMDYSDGQPVSSASVPEPATIALFGVGLLGLGFVRRLRKRK